MIFAEYLSWIIIFIDLYGSDKFRGFGRITPEPMISFWRSRLELPGIPGQQRDSRVGINDIDDLRLNPL
jgi:hypothetical protein